MRIRTSCNRDCPDACGIVATVDGGRVTRIEGDADHPVTRGFLCYRTNRFLDRQYDPDRVTTPLLRRTDGFVAIDWDEALDLVAAKMLEIRAESGAAAILHYRSGGSLGLMKHLSDFFFERFGPVTIKSGDVCSGAGDAAQLEDFGEEDSHDLYDLYNSRTIVLWGKNPYVSSVHLLPVLREARARGTRLILVDPVQHRTVGICDWYLQPRPGGDIALALGVARLLFERGLADADCGSYCDHVDEFRELCFSRGTEQWAALADVAPADLDRLASAFADGPLAILVGWGMQRRTYGSATVRVLDALGAVSGNIGVAGGGVSFYFKRRGAFDLSFASGLAAAPRSIPEPLLGPGILAASAPEIRMVWVTAGNPVAMLPESATVARALRTREFTVVVDSFITDTAECADLVLPTTTMLEDDDLVGAYGHHYLGNIRPVVPPPPGVKTDYEIIRQLAPRVGLNGEFSLPSREWKRRLLQRVEPLGVSLESLEQRPMRNPLTAAVLFADRKFPTASGKANLIRTVDPEPVRPTSDRPMLLMAISTDKAQGSQWRSTQQHGPPWLTVHPASAAGLADGGYAVLESSTGAMRVRLRFDGGQRRDVALIAKGGWFGRGRCANVLVAAKTTDAGGGAAYYDTPVRLLPDLDPRA
ncbi:MAG TPA: molybdopterin-dependent oxidoreductase [Candidatus Polarisedimenticolaceae bacterium]|nr:molybdopterin-dependent oxidoreductase [Candidatus Polarisedimenticolaceae bacterium]